MRPIAPNDLQNVSWRPVADGWWRIDAELTCAVCQVYQAADSDPVNDRSRAAELCARVYNSVGWRVDDQNRTLCPECAQKGPTK